MSFCSSFASIGSTSGHGKPKTNFIPSLARHLTKSSPPVISAIVHSPVSLNSDSMQLREPCEVLAAAAPLPGAAGRCAPNFCIQKSHCKWALGSKADETSNSALKSADLLWHAACAFGQQFSFGHLV